MLIAQITDIHLGFEPGNPDEPNRRRLDQTLEHLLTIKPRPDLLLLTGDLADKGKDQESYRQLKNALQDYPIPAHFCMGNHDSREPFFDLFSEVPRASGFLQYAIEGHPLRVLMLDTLEVNRHGGGFCEDRAAWLQERLSEQPERPTLLALHHPPIPTGLSWMAENPDSLWAERLRGLVAAHDNIVGLIAGHLHRPIVMLWAGKTLVVCPPTSPQLALDLDTIDPDQPDGRPMIVAAPPGFAIHFWTGKELITHFGSVQEDPVVARYDERFQRVVRRIAGEDPGR
jgi:3',5'-cyclic AMP phosphodiesterase CpdA